MAISISLGTIILIEGLCDYAIGTGTAKAPRSDDYGYEDIRLNNTDYRFGMNFSTHYGLSTDIKDSIDHAEVDFMLPDATEHLFDGQLELRKDTTYSRCTFSVFPTPLMMSLFGTVKCRFKLLDSSNNILASGAFNYTIPNSGVVKNIRKLDLWRHGIPPRIQVNQYDTNFSMEFMIYSSRGEASFVNSSERVPYDTELRATLPDGSELNIHGSLLERELRPFYRKNKGQTQKANNPREYVYIVKFKPTAELTAQIGEIPFEVILREISSFNTINGKYSYTGKELRTSNAKLIVEAKPE